jgi:hypothetical protein
MPSIRFCGRKEWRRILALVQRTGSGRCGSGRSASRAPHDNCEAPLAFRQPHCLLLSAFEDKELLSSIVTVPGRNCYGSSCMMIIVMHHHHDHHGDSENR